jgi:hypothetical protein
MLRIQEQGCAVCTYKFNTFLQKKKKKEEKKRSCMGQIRREREILAYIRV